MPPTDDILGAFLEGGTVLALHRLDLDLLFGDFFAKELDALSFLLIAPRGAPTDPVLADLQVELVKFALGGALPGPLVLKLRFKLIVSCLKCSLLAVQSLDLFFEFLLVRASYIEFFDGMLDILHASALFFLESSPLLLEALGAGSSMGLELLLMVLIDAELGQFELALLVLAQQGHLLRFTLKLGLVLLDKGILILLKLDLALFIEPVLFFPDQLLLFFLVLAEGALRLDLELVLVVLHLVAQHASTVLVLHLDFVLQLGELLLVLAFLLPLELQDLAIGLLLELALLPLQFALEFTLQVFELHVKL